MKQHKFEDDKVVITYHVINNEVVCSGRVKDPALPFVELYEVKHKTRDITLGFIPIDKSTFFIKTKDFALSYLALVLWFCNDWAKHIVVNSIGDCIVVDVGDKFIADGERYTVNIFDMIASDIFKELDEGRGLSATGYVSRKLDELKSMNRDELRQSIELINNVL